MEFTVAYDPTTDAIRVAATGRADVAGFKQVMDATGEIFDRYHCRRLLSDYRGLDLDFDHFNVAMLDDLAGHYLALASRRAPFSMAMVCADGAQFALTRVWEVLSAGADLDIQRRIFLNPDEARCWLDLVQPPRSGDAECR